MAEKRLSERDLRKSIREALAGNLGSIVFGGSFKVYDGGKNGIVIYRERDYRSTTFWCLFFFQFL